MSRQWFTETYETEIAVLFGFLAVFLPWNASYASPAATNSIGQFTWVRFPFFQVRTTTAEPAPFIQFLPVWDAYQYQLGTSVEFAYLLWVVSAALLAGLVVLIAALYLNEDRVERVLPCSPATQVGTVIGLSAGGFLWAQVELYQNGVDAVSIPFGTVLMFVFAYLLVSNSQS